MICGGTNYYIESLLWKVLIDQKVDEMRPKRILTEQNEENGASKKARTSEHAGQVDTDSSEWDSSTCDELTNEELHARLREIDPERAGELHFNDRRKVLRSIGGERQFTFEMIS